MPVPWGARGLGLGLVTPEALAGVDGFLRAG